MRQVLAIQQEIHSGTTAPTLSDLRVLNTPVAVRHGPDLWDALSTTTSFWVYTHVLLFPAHPVTTAFLATKQDLVQQESALRFQVGPGIGALVIWYMQHMLHY